MIRIVSMAILVLCIVSLAVGFKKRSFPIAVGALSCSLLLFSFYPPLFPAPEVAPEVPPFPYNVRNGQFFILARSTQKTEEEENAIYSGGFFLDISGKGLEILSAHEIDPSEMSYNPWTQSWSHLIFAFSSSSKSVSVTGKKIEITATGTFSSFWPFYHWNLENGIYNNFFVRIILDFSQRRFSIMGKGLPELVIFGPEGLVIGTSQEFWSSLTILKEHWGSYSLKSKGTPLHFPNYTTYIYVASGIPLTPPPPPPPPPPPDLRYSISSCTFSDGILISVEATFADGSFLPDGTKVSLLSPVAMDLIQVEKDEWICKIPLEYQEASSTLWFNVPGCLPKYVYFIPGQELADLRVYLYDQQTGNLAQGTFGVSVDGITKMGNPCVFEGVPTRVTISVNQISGDVKYYPAQETVNLSPWSSNTVNIYLTRVPEPESGDASVLIRVHVTDKPKLYFNGKESVVVWNPQGYWENKMENLKGGVEYCVSATCPGYYSQSIDITTQKGMTTFVDIYLEKMEPSQPVIWIRVYTENKPSVYVNDKSIALYPATSYKGIYWWNKVVAELGRNYIIKATCPGYIPEERIVRPESPKAQLLVDFFLSPEPHYEKPKTTLLTRVHVTTAKPTVYLDGKELPVVWRKGVWENLLEDIKEGIYTVRALCPGYYAETITVKVRDGETSVVDIYLSPENYRDNIETFLCTRIHSKDKPKLLVDGRETPVVWNVAGYWENTMKALGGKKYTITASCLGYQTKTVEVTAIERKTTVVDIYLSPENYKKETSLLIRVYVENKPNLKIDGKEAVVIRNPKGYWENKIENAVGGKTYVIYVSCPGYIGRKILATAVEGKITVVDVYLSPETRSKKPDEKFPNGTLDVTVLDRMTKLALPGVKIILSDGKEGTTNANGKAVFYNLQEGEYTVTAILEGYFDVTKKVIISGGRTTNLTINLSSYLFVAKEKPLYPERILLLLLLIFIASGAILVWRRR